VGRTGKMKPNRYPFQAPCAAVAAGAGSIGIVQNGETYRKGGRPR